MSASKKKPILLSPLGIPVGDNAGHLGQRVGDFVRASIPIRYPKWKEVPQAYKDDVWTSILDEFEFTPSKDAYRDECEKRMTKLFSKYKSYLRVNFLDPIVTGLEDQINNLPPLVEQNDWKAFCIHKDDPDAKKKREVNKSNIRKRKSPHTLGRKTYGRVEHEMKEKAGDPNQVVSRVILWKEGHKRRDGTIHPKATSLYEQVEQAEEAQARERASTDEGEKDTSHGPYDIENDALFRVFGPDTNGRVRGVSSSVSVTHLKHATPVLAKLKVVSDATSSKIAEEVNNQLKDIKCTVESWMQNVNSNLVKVLEQTGGGHSSIAGSHAVESFSHDIGDSSQPTPRSNSSPKHCDLLDWDDNVVARGRYWPNDQKVCNERPVGKTEMKVLVDSIECGETRLPKVPQGGCSYLKEISVGSFFVAWPKSGVRFDSSS